MWRRSILFIAMLGVAGPADAGELDGAYLRGSNAYDASPSYQVEAMAPANSAAYGGEPTPWSTLSSFGFEVEVGARFWLSSGKFVKNLFDDPRNSQNLNSRLTYAHVDGRSGEGFARLDHTSGFFIKSFAGLGSLVTGTLNDEDFPPGISPYSSTLSEQHKGTLGYATIDAGYNLRSGPGYKFGAFVGYNYFGEDMNALGCTQIAGNPFVCVPAISNSVLAITESAQWHSLRVGMAGEVTLFDRVKLVGDAAWLPYVGFFSRDTHWLRPDIVAPIPETGRGTGLQIEGSVNYQVTDALSVGVGARYWYMHANGSIQLEEFLIGVAAFAVPQPANFSTDRFGTFVQASYKFGL